MLKRPMIGVTPWYDYEKQMTFVKKGYCEAIIEAGGLPVLIPVTTSEEVLAALSERCDGFMVTGGPDVDPCYYGEYNLVYNGEISPYRDILEAYIVRKAIDENRPVLGICRGIQLINAVQGGTLYQDINSQVRERIPLKHSQEAPRWYPTHEIVLEPGSRAWSWFKSDRALVNSYHHQAIKDVAPGFKVTAKASDGVIESIEHYTHKYAVGVQWHPELLWQENRDYMAIFIDFVEACR